jgi:hypothetical protein
VTGPRPGIIQHVHATNDTSDDMQATPGEHPALGADLYCPDCGYNLRGLTSRRCPECGLVLDFIESDTPIIPWERRRELGRFRAYWQTVLMVMFRNKLFCRAAYRPVGYRDSQRFRWLCILHVFVAMIVFVPVSWALGSDAFSESTDVFGTWFIAFFCVCVLLTLLALTGLPSYFFHPKHLSVDQQNRAVALSYYSCAVLAWAPLLFALFAAIPLVPEEHNLDLVLLSVTIALAAVLPVEWLIVVIRIAGRTLRHPGTVLKTAILLPVLWVVVGTLFFAGLQHGVIYVLIIIHSLF